MRQKRRKTVAGSAAAWGVAVAMAAAGTGVAAEVELVVADGGKTEAVVAVLPAAGSPGSAERRAAADLVKYIGLMTGAEPKLADTREAIDEALRGKAPVFLVGEEALKAKPALAVRIRDTAKKNPFLRADAIGLLREGNRVYLAGNHDEAHYYAVSALLHKWGCRWYMPTDFGECIPEVSRLTLAALDETYAPPFEVRTYWISWNGDGAGSAEFRLRNFMTSGLRVPSGHALGHYVKELIPPGKSAYNVPIADEATARHVAGKVEATYAGGGSFSLGMDDGLYASDSAIDKELMALQYDKYMMRPAMTDNFMMFYNGVARILREKYPASKSRIGFLAYSNITLPPLRVKKAEPALVAYLAPIDIDPIHGMDDPQSPPRGEYREMLYGWAKVMEGRVVIYDYDQGMLVWRDLPNPSIQTLEQDFAHYREAGILGVDTESRNAIGTTFLNLHCRGQLLWNPDRKVEALLAEFYPAFYGPAAEPMAEYWGIVFDAWKNTIVTEHEHFVAPAIYTPAVVDGMRKALARAEAALKPLRAKAAPTAREKRFLDRMEFTRLSFAITENYLAMVRAAAADCAYGQAAAFGDKGLAAREAMTALNGTFTTYKRIGERGPSWWPGEVDQYRHLQTYLDGSNGTLVAKLPLEWAFRRDPDDKGLAEGWGLKAPDLTFWNEKGASFTLDGRKDYPPTEWEKVRTDLYLQAQGVRHPDRQSYTGIGWYTAEVELAADALKKPVRILFPGLFNACRLYVNGQEVAQRSGYNPIWWLNDYRFQWDVDLTGKLKAGSNRITLRIDNPHHFGGMFRRPFLYTPPAAKP